MPVPVEPSGFVTVTVFAVDVPNAVTAVGKPTGNTGICVWFGENPFAFSASTLMLYVVPVVRPLTTYENVVGLSESESTVVGLQFAVAHQRTR